LPESRVEDKTLFLSKMAATPIQDDWFTNNSYNKLYSLKENLTSIDLSGDDPILKHSPYTLHGMSSRSSQRWMYGGLIAYSTASKFIFGIDIDDDVFWEDERDDDRKVLTFTTESLDEDLEIVGPLVLKLWAKTEFTYPLTQLMMCGLVGSIKAFLGIESNLILDLMNEKNVQWVVELNDVFPQGRARNITSGWLMASHRQHNPDEPENADVHFLDRDYTPFDPFYNGPSKEPKLITEDELYQYAVELWPTCNVFKAGHRIRLTISGSDFPHFLPILRPSSNTIVIDGEHQATLDFKVTNENDPNKTWKWIGPAGNKPDSTFSDYLMTHRDEPDSQFDIEPDSQDDFDQETHDTEESFTQGSGGRSGDSSCFISIAQQ
jgi:hypothetical protein